LAVSMSGGSPWGFRLYGGDADPLVVAKVGENTYSVTIAASPEKSNIMTFSILVDNKLFYFVFV